MTKSLKDGVSPGAFRGYVTAHYAKQQPPSARLNGKALIRTSSRLYFSNRKLAVTRLPLAAAILFFSLPAFAETYYLDKDAWTCEGYAAIHDVERSAKAGGTGDMNLDKSAHCMFAGTLQNSKDGRLTNNPTNIMYVLAPYAYVCSKFTYCQQGQMPVFFCTYALISDIRDSHGATVATQQLQKEATGKTMADVKDFFPDWHPDSCDAPQK